MKPSASSEHDEQDREIIKLLQDLGAFKAIYPSELLTARREAFLAQVEGLSTADSGEELSAEDQEFVKLLGGLRSVQAEYPPDLLAARRSALLRQLEMAGTRSVWDRLRGSIFPSKRTFPTSPPAGFRRISLVIASLLAAVFLGSLFFSRLEQSFQPSPLQAGGEPTQLPTSAGEVTIAICKPNDETPSCPPGELDPSQDLANTGNGLARPAVSNDAHHKAAYVNDGRGGESWVSNSADSWIKIDLGKETTINTVSLQKGSLGPSDEDDPGQFVIAVALSDVYADGDSSHDYVEYAQVFHSAQAGFSGTVSHTETIRTQFPLVRARFVKITFEKAGAAIEEVGVFMVSSRELSEQPTTSPQDDLPGTTATPIHTNTSLAMNTATSVSTGTQLLTSTAVPTLTPTGTPPPSIMPSLLPTNTPPPADPSTPVPTDPLPSDTPIPLPPVVPPTTIPPTVEPSPISTDTIVVTESNQTLTFTCNGNAAEIRGHANTVTLLGSCSSITVTGNGNQVFWQFGSPVITIKGKDNIVRQL
jgi:hypothetical protein